MSDEPNDVEHALTRMQMVQTPTGPMALYRPVAERLLKDGVISGTLDGELYAADAARVKAATTSGAGVCDFCSAPAPTHAFDVPDFDLPGGVGRSTDGWAACDTCADLIRTNRRKDLVKRACKSMAFSKFTKLAIQELHNRFWRGMEQKQLPSEPTYGHRVRAIDLVDKVTGKPVANLDTVKFHRPETVDLLTANRMRMAHLPKDIANRLNAKWDAITAQEHVGLKSTADAAGHFTFLAPESVEEEDKLIHFLRRQLAEIDDELVKEQYTHAPAHVVALEQQLLAYRANSAVQHLWPNASGALQQATVDTLKVARTYCWAPNCIDAVVLRADMLPDEAMPGELPLGEVMEPAATGWWWFEKPVPLQSTSSGESVVALLWRRELNDQYSRTWFNAFIQETVTLNGRETLVPSPTLAWSWQDERSIAELHQRCLAKFDGLAKQKRIGYSAATAEESAKGAVWLSKFWMAGGLWLDSRVAGGKRRPSMLAKVTTPLPRQQGRQLARQFKLEAPPTVEVVYLRRTELRSDPSGPGRAIDHKFCWFVEAFPRRQWFPSLGKHQLIMVNEHIRGPRDRPLKHAKRVYAVSR